MDSKKLWRIGTAVALVAILIALLYLLRGALVPVFVALFLAYLLDPVIDRMEKRLNRSAAILILAGVALIVIGVGGVFLVVQAQREIVKVFHDMPQYLTRVQTAANPLAKQYLGMELPKTYEEVVLEIKQQISQVDPAALKPVSTAMTKVVKTITSQTLAFVGWVVGLIIIPVFLFYFLRDWDLLKIKAVEFIPLGYREYLVEKARQVDEVLGAFIRGQLTVCLTLGVLYSIGLLIVGVDLAVVIGLTAGIFFIIPYMGTGIGVVAGTIMALLEYGFSWHVVGVWVVFIVVQTFEGTLLTPRIMGEKVGLSPVVVIIALLVGANLLGFLGLLIAVPLAAVINVFVKDAIVSYQKSPFFKEMPSDREKK